MAIIVSTNGRIVVNGVDLSDHAKSIRVNDGQQTRSATAHGNTYEVFRAGLGTPSIEATFHNDHASGSVEATLRGLISVTSTGFTVAARKINSATTTVNPDYQMVAVIDGDLNVLSEDVGEIGEIAVRFVPYSTFTISTSAS